MKRILAVISGLFIAFCVIAYERTAHSEQGDYATLGYNMPGGYSYWRVDSAGDFIPGMTATYNIGTAALKPSAIYAVTASFTGQVAVESVTSTVLSTLVPTSVGAVVYNSTNKWLCYSSGTVAGAWVMSSSTSTACY